MPNRKYKIKDIITQNADGFMTNFGPLMIGYVNGIPCLAHREVLLLLGIKLGNHKPPQIFYSRLQMRIRVAGCYLTIYAVNEYQVDLLGKQLSKRDWEIKAYKTPHMEEAVKTWRMGELIEDLFPIIQPKHPDPFTYHTCGSTQITGKGRPYRTSRWHRFKLLVNRLFSKAA